MVKATLGVLICIIALSALTIVIVINAPGRFGPGKLIIESAVWDDWDKSGEVEMIGTEHRNWLVNYILEDLRQDVYLYVDENASPKVQWFVWNNVTYYSGYGIGGYS